MLGIVTSFIHTSHKENHHAEQRRRQQRLALSADHERVLAVLERTLRLIAGDYPNASPTYKRESFAIGAKDMAMTFVVDEPFVTKRAFAKRVDAIHNAVFPKEES